MGIVVAIILVGLFIRLIAGSMDSDRIQEEIEAKGGKLISKTWSPFGKGWLGDKSDRIYEVIYMDKQANKHKAFAKTSLFSGVYFTADEIIEYGIINTRYANEDPAAIREENERLKKEIEELKSKLLQ